MSCAEEIVAALTAKGEEIRVLKAAKPATLKDDLVPLVAELQALKLSYKELTGEEYGPAPAPKKEKGPAEVQSQREGPSKAELNKIARKEKAAAAKAAEREAKGLPPAAAAGGGSAKPEGGAEGDSELAHLYGDSPLIQSATMTDRRFRLISELADEKAGSKVGQSIWMRARVSNSRAVGKGIFLLLRQGLNSCQAIVWQSASVPKQMVKYAASISLESVVDILCEVTVPQEPLVSVTLKTLELQVKELHVVSKAQDLPFLIDDAGRNEAEAEEKQLPTVSQDTALNFRWVDLRTPANQAIFRIQSGVCALFREFLSSRNFVEIHTPKLIGGASEGGSNVFTLKYFDQPACLAQSPQLYKQMAAACGGLDRVFEIGPVFRAENSNTHRHLCEFTGLDFEMTIDEHYYEALDVMGNLFTFIFDGISDRWVLEGVASLAGGDCLSCCRQFLTPLSTPSPTPTPTPTTLSALPGSSTSCRSSRSSTPSSPSRTTGPRCASPSRRASRCCARPASTPHSTTTCPRRTRRHSEKSSRKSTAPTSS